MNNLKTDKYKLSAIVLVYNGEKLLRHCLNSLVNQTLENLEIILINDVSTDDSLSICREYQEKYDNIQIINKEINEGLATNANIGIKEAKGEYVILVDHDDIVPEDAYEKLYNKAKETDADICIGKANFLYSNYQREMNYENTVWEKERVIHDVNEFPNIFEDAFYWNKIMRRSFLIENNITLPKDMIYADRLFIHTAYIHAKTIAIIPDCVYLWRIVKKGKKSLSMNRSEPSNYTNRIDSYEIDLDKIIDEYKDYFKILMRRILVPIYGLGKIEGFEEVYYERGVKLLKEHYQKLDNIYDNNLNIINNIFLYLSINDEKEELKKLLELDLREYREIFYENGKNYWNLPIFRNPKLNIPDELFEIKYLDQQFLNIEKIIINDNEILFNNIELPRYLSISSGEIIFNGKTSAYDILENNTLSFKVEKVENEDRNLYTLKIPSNELKYFDIYDVFFKAKMDNIISNKIRLNNFIVKEIKNNSDKFRLVVRGNRFLFFSQNLKNEFSIICKDEELKIKLNNKNKLKRGLKAYVMKNSTKEKVFLKYDKEKSEFSLEWKFFLDINSTYNLYLTTFNDNGEIKKNIKLNKDLLKEFKKIEHKINKTTVKIYSTEQGNIVIRT